MGGREEREKKGKGGGKGPRPTRKTILAPPLLLRSAEKGDKIDD